MREPPVTNRKKSVWESCEPEVRDDNAPLGKDSCHASTPQGNVFMLEQVSLWKQVNLSQEQFCGHSWSST